VRAEGEKKKRALYRICIKRESLGEVHWVLFNGKGAVEKTRGRGKRGGRADAINGPTRTLILQIRHAKIEPGKSQSAGNYSSKGQERTTLGGKSLRGRLAKGGVWRKSN